MGQNLLIIRATVKAVPAWLSLFITATYEPILYVFWRMMMMTWCHEQLP